MEKILITKVLPQLAEDRLKEHFDVTVNRKDRFLTKAELTEAVSEYDGILSTIHDFFDADVLKEATCLRVLSNYGIGLDNIALDTAKVKGIIVCNTPDAVTQSTADLTFAILLSLVRRISEAMAFVKEDRWMGWDPMLLLGEELYGKRFGIIGYGRIGRAVAKRAEAFGLKVSVYHRRKLAEEVDQVSFEKLLETSDYLSLHVPLTDETKYMIDEKAFARMKKRPILINMARGSVVDTEALMRALNEGQIRGAALDVIDPEPLRADHPLCHIKNCLIVPHIGSATVDARNDMASVAANHLISALAESHPKML